MFIPQVTPKRQHVRTKVHDNTSRGTLTMKEPACCTTSICIYLYLSTNKRGSQCESEIIEKSARKYLQNYASVISQKVKTVKQECASRPVGYDWPQYQPVLYRRAISSGSKRSATSTNCGLTAERRPWLCSTPAPYSGRSQVQLPTCRRCNITADSHVFPEPSKANGGTLHQSHFPVRLMQHNR